MSFLKKPDLTVPQSVGFASKLDADQRKRWPAITEYCEIEKYEDGTARQTATLMLLIEQGTVKICLNDRDASRSCWMSGSSFLGVLDALEAALRKDVVEWRVRPQEGGRKKK